MSRPVSDHSRRGPRSLGGLLLCLACAVGTLRAACQDIALPGLNAAETDAASASTAAPKRSRGSATPSDRDTASSQTDQPERPAKSWINAGPLFETFPLTLRQGEGTEAFGPFFYEEEDQDDSIWGIPPLISYKTSHDGDRSELYVLPPLFTRRRYGEDVRWQLVQWINGSRQEQTEDPNLRRFNLFPFFFYQDATDPARDYWALFPLYGSLQNRFFRDEVDFVLFPGWLKTRKGSITTRNVLFPFVHFRDGPGLKGWQFWPLAGHEHREPTTRTNIIEEIEVVPGYDKTFALWPVYFRNRLGLGTDNPSRVDAALPFYYIERSAKRDYTSVLWPFFSWSDDRAEGYKQWNAPWPLVSFAHGEGKTLKRVLPFFSVGHTKSFEGETYMWPLYRRRHLTTENMDRDRRQIAVLLYSDVREEIKGTGQVARRIDSWPLFTWRRDRQGNERLQALALIEPISRASIIERNWSPLWSVWRQERNATTGTSSQSLLWNLYRRDSVPGTTKGSLLFGLIQYEKSSAGRRWRLFYLGPQLPKPVQSAESQGDVPEHR